MDALQRKYERQLKEYDALLVSGDKTKLREVNVAISKTLHEMIEMLTFLKKETPSLKQERDELLVKLRRIQRDYNGLVTNTDELETLRRIRAEESDQGKRELSWYLLLFLLASFCLMVYVFLYGRKEATAAIASAVPTTPALT